MNQPDIKLYRDHVNPRWKPIKLRLTEAPTVSRLQKFSILSPTSVSVLKKTTEQIKDAARGHKSAANAFLSHRYTDSSAGTRPYEILLPKPGELGDGSDNAASAPRATPQQMSGALNQADLFDVPLSYREEHYGCKAIAKIITSTSDRYGWRFDYVDGDPMLRAVLFESLQDESNRSRVPGLIDFIGHHQVIVVLSIELVSADDPTRLTADTVTLQAQTVRIIRRVFQTPRGIKPNPDTQVTAGIPISDDDSRKAITRDHSRIARFQTSAAYLSAIRNRAPDGA